MHPFSLVHEVHPEIGLKPAADAAGRTGAVYVDASKFHKVFVLFYIEQGNAATVACSLSKASDAAGTGAATVSDLVPIWTNLDMAAGAAYTERTAAANYTTDAALKTKAVLFEVDPVLLGTKWFIAPVTGASNAANITSALVFGVSRNKVL
jgi:alkylation response protein AidB-like acyl-CoA dehydrogenase